MTVLELIAIIASSLIVLVGMFVMVKGFLNRESDTTKMILGKEIEHFKTQIVLKNRETSLPIRLQAYERMALFCARIELGGLILRTHAAGMRVGELKMYLIGTIEEEFGHNVTQQVYISDDLWNLILLAKTEAINIIKMVAKTAGDDSPSQAFIDALVKYTQEEAQQGYIQAQQGIKKEVSLLF